MIGTITKMHGEQTLSRYFIALSVSDDECPPYRLSLSVYVLADDVLRSSFILHFLVFGLSPFPLPDYIHYQWSLSLPLQTAIRSFTEIAHII